MADIYLVDVIVEGAEIVVKADGHEISRHKCPSHDEAIRIANEASGWTTQRLEELKSTTVTAA